MLSVGTPECRPSVLALTIQLWPEGYTSQPVTLRGRGACYVPNRQSLRHSLPSSLATPGDREHALFSTGQRKVQRGGHGAQSCLPTLRPASGPPTACVPAPAPPPASPPPSLYHATCPQAAVRTRPWRLHLNSVQKGSSNSRNRSESLGQQERLYKRQAAQHGSLFPTCGTPRTITGTGAACGPALALGARSAGRETGD